MANEYLQYQLREEGAPSLRSQGGGNIQGRRGGGGGMMGGGGQGQSGSDKYPGMSPMEKFQMDLMMAERIKPNSFTLDGAVQTFGPMGISIVNYLEMIKTKVYLENMALEKDMFKWKKELEQMTFDLNKKIQDQTLKFQKNAEDRAGELHKLDLDYRKGLVTEQEYKIKTAIFQNQTAPYLFAAEYAERVGKIAESQTNISLARNKDTRETKQQMFDMYKSLMRVDEINKISQDYDETIRQTRPETENGINFLNAIRKAADDPKVQQNNPALAQFIGLFSSDPNKRNASLTSLTKEGSSAIFARYGIDANGKRQIIASVQAFLTPLPTGKKDATDKPILETNAEFNQRLREPDEFTKIYREAFSPTARKLQEKQIAIQPYLPEFEKWRTKLIQYLETITPSDRTSAAIYQGVQEPMRQNLKEGAETVRKQGGQVAGQPQQQGQSIYDMTGLPEPSAFLPQGVMPTAQGQGVPVSGLFPGGQVQQPSEKLYLTNEGKYVPASQGIGTFTNDKGQKFIVAGALGKTRGVQDDDLKGIPFQKPQVQKQETPPETPDEVFNRYMSKPYWKGQSKDAVGRLYTRFNEMTLRDGKPPSEHDFLIAVKPVVGGGTTTTKKPEQDIGQLPIGQQYNAITISERMPSEIGTSPLYEGYINLSNKFKLSKNQDEKASMIDYLTLVRDTKKKYSLEDKDITPQMLLATKVGYNLKPEDIKYFSGQMEEMPKFEYIRKKINPPGNINLIPFSKMSQSTIPGGFDRNTNDVNYLFETNPQKLMNTNPQTLQKLTPQSQLKPLSSMDKGSQLRLEQAGQYPYEALKSILNPNDYQTYLKSLIPNY